MYLYKGLENFKVFKIYFCVVEDVTVFSVTEIGTDATLVVSVVDETVMCFVSSAFVHAVKAVVIRTAVVKIKIFIFNFL